jgi:hypothetical protein
VYYRNKSLVALPRSSSSSSSSFFVASPTLLWDGSKNPSLRANSRVPLWETLSALRNLFVTWFLDANVGVHVDAQESQYLPSFLSFELVAGTESQLRNITVRGLSSVEAPTKRQRTSPITEIRSYSKPTIFSRCPNLSLIFTSTTMRLINFK